MTKKTIQVIAIINAYVLVFLSLIMLQKYTLGFIPGIKEVVLFGKFYLWEWLFTFNAVIIMALFVKIPSRGKTCN